MDARTRKILQRIDERGGIQTRRLRDLRLPSH